MKKYTELFSEASRTGHVLFFAILFFEHFFGTELSPTSHLLSEYSSGSYGWVHIGAFIILGFSQLFFFAALVANVKSSPFGLITFSIYSLSLFITIMFPTDTPGSDSTISGIIHSTTAVAGLLSLNTGMFAWGLNFRKTFNWENPAKVTFWFAACGIMIFFAIFLTPVSIAGLFQRLLLLCDLVWVIIISQHLYLLSTISQDRSTPEKDKKIRA
jgi:hypothetical protein